MRVAFLVFLLLSVVVIERSEAGWFKKAWGKIKKAAKTVVGWAKKNCTVGTGGVNCSLRGRRAAGLGPPGPEMVKSKQEMCDSVLEGNVLVQEGVPFDLVKDIFEVVDGGNNGNDILDGTEFDEFVESLAVFHECLQSAKRK